MHIFFLCVKIQIYNFLLTSTLRQVKESQREVFCIVEHYEQTIYFTTLPPNIAIDRVLNQYHSERDVFHVFLSYCSSFCCFAGVRARFVINAPFCNKSQKLPVL